MVETNSKQTDAPSAKHRRVHRWTQALANTFGLTRTKRWQGEPFVAVLGLHSSGSSATAGVLHHLGVHMGNALGGYYGKDPNASCGFEDRELIKLCERTIPFASTRWQRTHRETVSQLGKWIARRRKEAMRKGTIAGGKYPQMCCLGEVLSEIVGEPLRVVHINRPLNESITSICRRSPHKGAKALAAHQEWLWECRTKFFAGLSAEAVLHLKYSVLLSQPDQVVSRIVEFLDLRPSVQQIAKAISYVDPNRRHVFSAPASQPTRSERRAA